MKLAEIQWLVEHAFPGGTLPAPSLADPHRRDSPAAADRRRTASAYRAELEKLPDSRIKRLYERENGRHTFKVAPLIPPDEHLSADDYSHWSKKANWTLEEAAALTSGKSPDAVAWERRQKNAAFSPLLARLFGISDLIQRAKQMGDLRDPVRPEVYLNWAHRSGIDIPPELEAPFLARRDPAEDWEAQRAELQVRHESALAVADARAAHLQSQVVEYAEKLDSLERELVSLRDQLERAIKRGSPIPERSRRTAYKLLLGMAKARYRYDPDALRTEAVSKIKRDLDLQGLKLDEDTIREWLRQAAEYLAEEGHE